MSPFAILVVEILLTKTRAEIVAPIAPLLLARYPTPSALARANPRTLERILYPLGLHRKRARQLIACAAALAHEHGGEVPTSVEALLKLPAVGRYAANAVASVAFGQRRSVIDANIARIYGRVFSLAPPPPRLSSAHDLWVLATRLLPRKRSKEFTWAVLDLGGTVCAARNPACPSCPLSRLCDYGATRAEIARVRRKVVA
ncbi:MAG: A/G-specific adenine glycosylase [Deltaproteobacteria bacterium]|nr:A/G-specific adenine glycosylase [Kofleriaceae bacterium]